VTRRLKPEALTPRQQRLVEEALPTAQALVRRTARLKGIHKEEDLEELDQTVGEVLSTVVRGYDETRPTGFLNYAWKRMFGTAAELIDSLSRHAKALEIAAEGAEELADSTDPFSESPEEADEDDFRELDAGADAFTFDLYIVDAISSGGLSEPLKAALDAVDPDERRAFLARHRDDIKFEEIASMMGMDRSKVRRLISSARKKLKRLLLAQGIREAPK
jgi:RNA polymerase sigma factor (sigma-70 family)